MRQRKFAGSLAIRPRRRAVGAIKAACPRLRATSAMSLCAARGSSMRSARPDRSVGTRTQTGGAIGRPQLSSTKSAGCGVLRALSAGLPAVPLSRHFRLGQSSFRATATLAMPYRPACSVARNHRSSGRRALRGQLLRHAERAVAVRPTADLKGKG